MTTRFNHATNYLIVHDSNFAIKFIDDATKPRIKPKPSTRPKHRERRKWWRWKR